MEVHDRIDHQPLTNSAPLSRRKETVPLDGGKADRTSTVCAVLQRNMAANPVKRNRPATNAEAQARYLRVLARAVNGENLKSIAVDEQMAEHTVRTCLWRQGMKTMQLTEQERDMIVAFRKARKTNG